MTALQDFREQYPQYSDIDDEQLGEALYKRYYSDMDPKEYRSTIGLPDNTPPAPPPEPSIIDRITTLFDEDEKKPANALTGKSTGKHLITDSPAPGSRRGYFGSGKPVKPTEFPKSRRGNFQTDISETESTEGPRAPLMDQLWAGVDEYRANRKTRTAFDAITKYGQADDYARGLTEDGATGTAKDRKIRNQYASRGTPEQRGMYQAEIAGEAEQIREEQLNRLQEAIDASSEQRNRAGLVPYHANTKEMLEAKTFGEGFEAFANDPIMIVAETSLRSLPNMAEALPLALAGAMVAGPWGFAGGMGIGSGMAEYRSGFSEYLQENDVDVNDAQALVNAANNLELMERAHKYAGSRAGIIGLASAAGGGLATRNLTPMVKNAVGRELANVGAQTVAQGSIEGSGEALAQLATTGEIAPGEVMAEMTGSLIDAPIEVGSAVITGVRSHTQQQRAKRIEDDLRDILDSDRDPDPAAPEPDPETPPGADPETPPENNPVSPERRTELDQFIADIDTELLAFPKDITSMDEETFLELRELRNERVDLIDERDHGLDRDEAKAKRAELRSEAFNNDISIPKFVTIDEIQALIDGETTRGPAAVPIDEKPTREELDAVKDIPTVEVMREAVESVGKEEFERRVKKDLDSLKKTSVGPISQVEEALRVELVARDIVALNRRKDSAAPDPAAPPATPERVDNVFPGPDFFDQALEGQTVAEQKDNLEVRYRQVPDKEITSVPHETYKNTSPAELLDQAGHAAVAAVNLDSFDWINKNLGADAGDAALVALEEALNQDGIQTYRTDFGGFYIGAATRESVEAAVSMAEGILANQKIEAPGGTLPKIGITSAIGEGKAQADAANKSVKTKSGPPEGVTLAQRKAEVVDFQPGTNHVPHIGNTGQLPINANHELVLQTTGKPVRIPKKPVRREHIIGVMKKYFGNRIYQGRVRGKLRLGFYRPGHGEVRLKNHNDIEVAAHEIAHFLDDRYPWIGELYKAHDAEVRAVSYDVDVKLLFEGYAEFMRLWMTQEPDAARRAPAFYDAFNKKTKATDPKLWNMLLDLQELMHAWTMQGARARGASKQGETTASIYERMRTLLPVNVVQSTLDGLRSIKTIAADLSDQEAPQVRDAYDKLRLAVGGSSGVLEAAMFYASPAWRADGQGIEDGGESLQAIWGNDWGREDVAMYMIAKRAEELKGQGRENLLRVDEIVAWLSLEKDRPELLDKWERHQEFNTRVLDFAEGGGILGPKQRASFEEMNQNYVPFHRVAESVMGKTEVRQGGNPWKRLSGGTRNINNIWDNIVNNTGVIIRMAMINDGKRSLLRHLGAGTVFDPADPLGVNVERNQQAGVYASPIPTEIKPVWVHGDQVTRKAVEAMGITWQDYRLAKTGMLQPGEYGEYLAATLPAIEAMEAGIEQVMTFFQPGQAPMGPDVVSYQDGDKSKFFQVNDPNLMDTFNFLGPKGTNLVLGIFGAFSATLRRGVVSVPVFQMKNFVRDTTNAWLLSDNVKVPAVRAMRVVFSRMGKDPRYVEMLLNGGGFANRSQGLQAQRKVIIDPTHLTAMYDRFMGRFENANRLAEFAAARENGKSPRAAAMASRDISTDFAMRGSSTVARFLAISVPFLNARSQGLYRAKRQFDRKELAFSYAARGLALAAATMALYAMNKDDERYKELPEDIKDLYWVFYTGEGEDDYFLLPKPFESGMLFATIPERMFEYAEQENGKEFADALTWMMLSTFHMDMTPQAFQPWADLAANKKFTGAPIIPYYLQNVDPGQQFNYYTSDAVRIAAQSMGISPMKMEHVLRGYLGTLGTYSLAAADSMISAVQDPEDRKYGEDPTRGDSWRENIIVKGLIDPLVNEGPPRRTKYKTDLYDMIREASKTTNTIALHQRRSIDELAEYLENPENLAQYSTHQALESARKSLGKLREARDQVRMLPLSEMNGDQKREAIWEITRDENRVARQTVLEISMAQAEAANQKRGENEE